MPTKHVVQQGECLSRIAWNYGFHDYRSIYEDAENEAFRKLRPNPNLIYPGDTLYIPDKDIKFAERSTGQRHAFVVRSLSRLLRLVLYYEDKKPIANKSYQLTVGKKELTGHTNKDGVLEESIAKWAEDAVLKIDGYTWNIKIAHLNPMEGVDDEGVSGMQMRLKNLSYYTGPVDGDVGPLTRKAIRDFQADNDLRVDGICGPKTRKKLREVHGGREE
jgi:N-acetylmuramoyl-L-alanine amidase